MIRTHQTKGDGNKMTCLNDLGRRSFLKIAAALSGASTVGTLPNLAGAQDTDTPAITLQDVPFRSGAKLTIERRGQIVLFGVNRPYIQNRIDPEAFEKLAEAYYQYDHDPSLRAAILFGHGENFSRGIDVEGFKSLAGTGKPWVASTGTIDPLAKRRPFLTKPLVVVTHGDTWNMAHELHLVADIRIASADTRFGQDENTHGRFPGGGSSRLGECHALHPDRRSLERRRSLPHGRSAAGSSRCEPSAGGWHSNGEQDCRLRPAWHQDHIGICSSGD
jgi:enoyl-CoA hydratase/isomerase-like protein